MKQEAVDYGYVPKHIAQTLDPENPAPVSTQIENLISTGRVGPEGFPVSLAAAYAESILFAQTAPTPQTAYEHAEFALFYRRAISSGDLQELICKMKVDDMLTRQSEFRSPEDRLLKHAYALAAVRWISVCQTISEKRAVPKLRIVR